MKITRKVLLFLSMLTFVVGLGACSQDEKAPEPLSDEWIKLQADQWIDEAYFGSAELVETEIRSKSKEGEGQYKANLVVTLKFSKTSTELGRELAKDYLKNGGRMQDFEEFYFTENSRFSGMGVDTEEKRALPLTFTKAEDGKWIVRQPVMLPDPKPAASPKQENEKAAK